ncbi:MAG: pYEATS domain-containing protein [Flavobacterium sp.]|uniref:pYEATS domain-containing protein n=1 Tax=Flavobacterium sp. TaxID=239 RepID=UPI0032659925
MPPTITLKYKIAQEYKYEGDDWWSWWIWIDGGNNDLDQIVQVIYTLHSTFHNPVRKIKDRKTKFRLDTEGWGTFVIYAKLVLRNGQEVGLRHRLHLEYPDGSENKE